MSEKNTNVHVSKVFTYEGKTFGEGLNPMSEKAAAYAVKRKFGRIQGESGEGSDNAEKDSASDFQPLPIKETLERMSQGDLSDEVLDSMKVHRDVIQEAQKSGKSLSVFLAEMSEKEKSDQKSEVQSGGQSKTENQKGEGKTDDKTQTSKVMGLPEDLPMKHILEKPNKFSETGFNTVAEVQGLTREQLIDIDGIAEKTADKILAYGKGGE
jgi:hypothetical protein